MGGIGSGDADIGLAYLHDGDGGELQVIGGLSCIVGNGQGKTTSFADIAEAEGLIGHYLFPVNMYNGLGIRYADGGGIVIQTGGIGYNQQGLCALVEKGFLSVEPNTGMGTGDCQKKEQKEVTHEWDGNAEGSYAKGNNGELQKEWEMVSSNRGRGRRGVSLSGQ